MSIEGKDKPAYRSARERAESHKSGYESKSVKLPEGMKSFRLKADGKINIDIVPFIVGDGNPYAEKGERHYERTFFVHRGVGPNEDSFTCLAKRKVGHEQKCPVCEARAKLARSDDADEKAVKALKPSERQLYLVIDHANREAGVQLWDISFHLFGRALNIALKELDEGDPRELFYHPKRGFSIRGMVEEKPNPGGKPFFSVERVSFKDRLEPLEISVAEMPCLDDCVVIPSYDDLKSALSGTDKGDDDDDEAPPAKKRPVDDDDEAPPAKKKAAPAEEDEPAPKKKAAPAEDDDDAPPAKKAKSKLAEDPDWEDDDKPAKKKAAPAEDDEDDETPPPKKKAAPAAEDDDDEAPPAKKKAAPAAENDDWDDAPAPKKKAAPAAEEDDETPAPKKKAAPAAEEEDWDDAPAPKKKKPAVDDDE